MGSAFGPRYLTLPGLGKDAVEFIMQIAVEQYFPFISVKPDSIAATAVVELEAQVSFYLIAYEDSMALWAEFRLRCIVDFKIFGLFLLREYGLLPVEPGPVVGRGEPFSITRGALFGLEP